MLGVCIQRDKNEITPLLCHVGQNKVNPHHCVSIYIILLTLKSFLIFIYMFICSFVWILLDAKVKRHLIREMRSDPSVWQEHCPCSPLDGAIQARQDYFRNTCSLWRWYLNYVMRAVCVCVYAVLHGSAPVGRPGHAPGGGTPVTHLVLVLVQGWRRAETWRRFTLWSSSSVSVIPFSFFLFHHICSFLWFSCWRARVAPTDQLIRGVFSCAGLTKMWI